MREHFSKGSLVFGHLATLLHCVAVKRLPPFVRISMEREREREKEREIERERERERERDDQRTRSSSEFRVIIRR
jgi:hypothetical protein